MKKILFLLFVATMTNIQGIMAQEKIRQTTEADGKAAFQREMIFPIGEPNTAYAKYFIGNSYLAPISKEQIPFSNVTFEPGCRNNWHIHHATKGGGQQRRRTAGLRISPLRCPEKTRPTDMRICFCEGPCTAPRFSLQICDGYFVVKKKLCTFAPTESTTLLA